MSTDNTFQLTETNLQAEARAQVMRTIQRRTYEVRAGDFIPMAFQEMDGMNNAAQAVAGYMQDWVLGITGGTIQTPMERRNQEKAGDVTRFIGNFVVLYYGGLDAFVGLCVNNDGMSVTLSQVRLVKINPIPPTSFGHQFRTLFDFAREGKQVDIEVQDGVGIHLAAFAGPFTLLALTQDAVDVLREQTTQTDGL